MNRSPIAATVERHRLAEVAQRTGIALNATCGTVTVRCPLPSHGHPDRTPSMRLYLDHGRYYCFGCGARGDVIQWVRDAERASLSEALRLLNTGGRITNTWAGGAPSNQNSLSNHRRRPQTGPIGEDVNQAELPDLHRTSEDRVRLALQSAWSYYTYRPLHARGVVYLAGRGVDVAVLEDRTGRREVDHTPAKPDGLVSALRTRGFSNDELVDAGLAYRRLGTNELSDFYRQRVLMALRDDQGQVCGFVGRNVGDARWPKYKNPPRTHAYDKSDNLFRPLPAPTNPSGQVVVVEGTLDALAITVTAVKAGRAEAYCPVTQSGRELSATQIRRILDLHQAAPVLGFDADPAGLESAFRYTLAFAQYGRAVIVTRLPAAHDPASWLAEQGPGGLSAWSRQNHSSWDGPAPIPAATFAAQYLMARDLPRTVRMETLVEIANLAKGLPGRSACHWAQRVAALAGPAAAAEAHDHVLSKNRPTTRRNAEIDLANWQPEPGPEFDIGFEAAVGARGTEAFIERVAVWGRRLPSPGDPIFIRAASVTIEQSGILAATPAAICLEQAMRRIERSIDPPEATAPALTTETVGL